MTLIALVGKRGSGKDTTAGYIKDFISYADLRAFATPLKRSLAALLGITIDKIEAMKRQEDVRWTPCRSDADGIEYVHDAERDIPTWNMRQLLQRYGSEAHREIFGEDFWTDQTLPPDLDHSRDLIVITDCRTPAEMDRIADLDGNFWLINRPNLSAQWDPHPTEAIPADFHPDYIINNNSTPDDLKRKVREGLIAMGYDGLSMSQLNDPPTVDTFINEMKLRERTIPDATTAANMILKAASALVNNLTVGPATKWNVAESAADLAALAYSVAKKDPRSDT